MIVYVESNFLLEIARQQEDAHSARRILAMARAGTVRLIFPALAVSEPFSTLTYYGAERNRFVDGMNRQLRELGRLGPYKGLATALQPLSQTLLTIHHQEMQLLESTVETMLTVGTPIPLTTGLFRDARGFETQYGLSPQDAIVLSSVLSDLRRRPRHEPKCFVSRNPKDFDDQAITSALGASRCRYIAKFSDAVSFLRSPASRVSAARDAATGPHAVGKRQPSETQPQKRRK